MKNIDKDTYIRLRKKYGSMSNADFAELLNNDYQTRNGKKFNKKLVGKMFGAYLFIVSCRLFYEYFTI